VQFTDLNPELTPFQRRYVAFIKRCDEIERKIRYVNGEVVKLGVPVQSAGSVEHFVDNQLSKSDSVSASSLLEGLESKLDKYEQQLLDLNKYNNKLTEEYNGKVELHHVLLKARTAFMSEVTTLGDNESQDRNERSALAMVEAVSVPSLDLSLTLPVALDARCSRWLPRRRHVIHQCCRSVASC
jgi:V-type H+-transporting ATPase subunit a